MRGDEHMCLKNSCYIICLIILLGLIGACSNNDINYEKTISTNIEFVQEKFPNIKNVESVIFSYLVKDDDRSIGLAPKEFSGIICIGPEFAKSISEKYKWKKCKQPVDALFFEKGEYHFLYNENFEEKYRNSMIGTFYYDKEKQVIYFTGEY